MEDTRMGSDIRFIRTAVLTQVVSTSPLSTTKRVVGKVAGRFQARRFELHGWTIT